MPIVAGLLIPFIPGSRRRQAIRWDALGVALLNLPGHLGAYTSTAYAPPEARPAAAIERVDWLPDLGVALVGRGGRRLSMPPVLLTSFITALGGGWGGRGGGGGAPPRLAGSP